MEDKRLKYLTKALGKATSAYIRLFKNNELLYDYSIFPIYPDPFTLYKDEMFLSNKLSGIITTDMFQLYGYVCLEQQYRIVIGPSSILIKDANKLKTLLFLLNVEEKSQEEYVNILECAPSITAERMSYLLSFIATALNSQPQFVEDINVNTEVIKQSFDSHNHLALFNDEKDEDNNEIYNNYQNEKLLLFYIKNGQVDCLKELFSAYPKIKAGPMANDTLRQLKNSGICCATGATRAAIEGGLNIQTAYHLSDLYIQKFEMIQNTSAIYPLLTQMILDFAQRCKTAKYNCDSTSKIFKKSAHYISEHLSDSIKVEDMAHNFNISRSYLCSQFHQQTGVTLTQYILQEKIIEAQRLLQFTDKSISEIAFHLSFSSQSHFQSVFKKYTNLTPNHYREINTNP